MSKFDTFYAIFRTYDKLVIGVIILGMLGYAYLLPQDKVYMCGDEPNGYYYRLTHYVDDNLLILVSTDTSYADHEMKTLGITDEYDTHIRAVQIFGNERGVVYEFDKTTYELTQTYDNYTPIDVTYQCISDS